MALPLPRRTKSFEKDGAKFIIAPLTYNEVEEYAVRLKVVREKLRALGEEPIPVSLREEMRDDAFFVVCCGLNNAMPDVIAQQDRLLREEITVEEYAAAVAPFAITQKIIMGQMDDQLGAAIASEVLKFNGMSVSEPGEKPKDAGESPASS